MGENQMNRLNPVALPTETNARFALLVVAAFMVAINVGTSIPYELAAVQGYELKFPLAEVPQFPNQETSIDQSFQQAQAAFLTESSQAFVILRLPIGLVIAIFLLAAIIYRLHPNRVHRQKNLERLSVERDPAFHREIERLARVAGVSPSPSTLSH